MALREEAFLDTAKIEATTGVTYGVTRPTKSASNPIWPTLASDGSLPDWGVGYSSARVNGATTELFTTCFDSPSVNTVHLGTPQTTDGVTITRPSRGITTFNGNTGNNLVSPTGLTRNQYRVAYDETTSLYVLTVYVDTGPWLAIDIYTAAAPLTAGWGSRVKRLTNPFGTGYCEPMAFWRRTDGRAVIYAQGVTTGHASYGGLRRHVAMLLGPSDGSLTGTWTSQGNILTAASDSVQYYHSGAWVDGELVYVPVGIFNGDAAGPPTIGTFNGTVNRIHKVSLYTARADDGTTLTLADADWLSSTGTYGAWDGGEIIGGNNVAEVADEWRYYFGGDGNTHHQSPESIRLMGLATVGRRRVGKITGTGTARTTLITAASAGELTINSTGTVEVELLDASNNVITGYARADCDAIPSDTFDHTVTWDGSRVAPDEFKVKLYLTSGTVYHLTAEEATALTADGYGSTTSAGYGTATAFDPSDASLTIDPASTAWEQVDTSIIVRTTAATPPLARTVTATVYSPAGGLLRLRGTDASLFAVSLDGTTWASTIDVPAGTTTVHLAVTPVTPGTTLTAEIGIPA